jgi:hypothetical protein
MFTPESFGFYENWDGLQEPARPGPFPTAYLLLLAAIDTGWKIEGPAKIAPRRGTSGQFAYQFKLRLHPHLSAHVLCVPHGREVEDFIRDESLQVVRTSGLIV